MATPRSWKFRLETLPQLGLTDVRLYVAAQRQDYQFKNLIKTDGVYQPVSYGPRTCDAKGYEVGKDEYAIIDPEDLEAAYKVRDGVLRILRWVPLSCLENLVFDDKSYYIAPEDNSHARQVFALYVATLKKAKRIAIGKFILTKKEYCFFLKPMSNGLLMLQTFHYPEDVRVTEPLEYDSPKVAAGAVEKMLKVMEISEMVGEYEPKLFQNEVRERVGQVIEAAKHKTKANLKPIETDPVAVPDLYAELDKVMAEMQAKAKAKV